MKKIALVGAGGFAREVYHQLLDTGHHRPKNIRFYVDEEYADNINSFPLSAIHPTEYVLVCIANPKIREEMVNKLPTNTLWYTFIHPSAIILDEEIEIGHGGIICAGSIITTNISMGHHFHLNLHTTIGHDCVIGDYFTTAPGVKVSGNCNIGNRVYIGTNASLREKLTITDDVTIGLNAGVVKNIDMAGVYVGVPAKQLK